MPKATEETYPGTPPKDRSAHPADGLIHRHVTKIIASRGEGESTADPDAPVSKRAQELFDEMLDLGIDLQRIRIGSAVAQIQMGQQIVEVHGLSPEDFNATA